MLDIQRKQITTFAEMLAKWGVAHKIVLPDGTEFGELEIAVSKPRKRAAPTLPLGTITSYFLPFIQDLKAGDVVAVPFGQFTPESLRGSIGAWAIYHWGKGVVTTYANRETQCVEVLRVA